MICEEFKVNPTQYALWDIDKIYGDPCTQVKNEKGSWGKNSIRNGEKLILQKLQNKDKDNFITLTIYETKTGCPDDCKKIEEISVDSTLTLDQLK